MFSITRELSGIISDISRLKIFISHDRIAKRSYAQIVTIEKAADISPSFQFSQQVIDLAERIEALKPNLERSLVPILGFQNIHEIHLKKMGDLDLFDCMMRMMKDILFRVRPIPSHPSSSESESDGSEIDSIGYETEKDSIHSNEEALDIILEKQKRYIYFKKAYELEILDELFYQVLDPLSPVPEEAHFQNCSDQTCQSIPAFFAAALIQKSSFETYQSRYPNTTLNFLERERIQLMNLHDLAKVLFVDPDYQAIRLKLIQHGVSLFQENPQLLTLAFARTRALRDHIQKIKAIASMYQLELRKELAKAMQLGSTVFIKAVLTFHHVRVLDPILEEIFIWCASRARNEILDCFPLRRLQPLAFYEGMKAAHLNDHEDTFQLIFKFYQDFKIGNPHHLFVGLCYVGDRKGISYLFSTFPPGSFAPVISEAFENCHHQGHYDCFEIIFKNHNLPEDALLESAFEQLCKQMNFDALQCFLDPLIFSKIARRGEIINQAIEDVCQYDRLEYLPFFFQSPIQELLTENFLNMMARSFGMSQRLRWKNLSNILESFFASPLYERLSLPQLFDFLKNAIVFNQINLSIAILNSRRGKEITQQPFEEMVVSLSSIAESYTIIKLLRFPRYQPFHPAPLGVILEKFVEKGSCVVQDLFSLPSKPLLSQKKFEEILAFCINFNQCDTLDDLVRELPNRDALTPSFLRSLFLYAASKGLQGVLSIPYKHEKEMEFEDLKVSLFEALKQNHFNCAQEIYKKMRSHPGNQSFKIPLHFLEPCCFRAIAENHLDFFKFIYTYFSSQMIEEFNAALYHRAKNLGAAELAGLIWSQLWYQKVKSFSNTLPKEGHGS